MKGLVLPEARDLGCLNSGLILDPMASTLGAWGCHRNWCPHSPRMTWAQPKAEAA